MKKFVELIKRVHQERYSVVINKILAEKIPVAFLSIAPLENAVATVKNLRAQGMNVTNLITVAPPPPDFQADFSLTPLGEISKIHPRPEYVFTVDLFSARLGVKNAPDCKTISMDRGGTEHIYEIFMNHLDDLQEVYASLIDEFSRRTFYGYWLGSISNQLGELVHANTPHYLTAGFIPEPGAVVIDGGTFDGGSAVIFSEMGYKVYGFEMDKKALDIVKPIAAEKGFIVENCGLGSYKHEMHYNAAGDSCTVWNENGTDVAQVIPLDAYVRENKIPRVDFIKLDVEGAELDVLKGAAVTISRWKPILNISAYHKWDDFWVLMNFIKSIRPDYEFALRHYPASHEDAPSVMVKSADDFAFSLGLDANQKRYNECCLLAR